MGFQYRIQEMYILVAVDHWSQISDLGIRLLTYL